MNGYVAFYNQRRVELYAPSLYAAKVEAERLLKVPANKRHMISVVLAEKSGEPVVHDPGSIG